MTRAVLRIAVLGAALGVGWIAGHAQSSHPDFEIVVNAPEGETTLQCVRGCELAWVERGLNPASAPMRTFRFNCQSTADRRCSSHKVGGWLRR